MSLSESPSLKSSVSKNFLYRYFQNAGKIFILPLYILIMRTLFFAALQPDLGREITSSRPEVVLHAGMDESARVIAMAKFHSVVAGSTEFTLCPSTQHDRNGASKAAWKSIAGTSP